MTRPRLLFASLAAALALAGAATVLLGAAPGRQAAASVAGPLPTPQSVFGFPACADRSLATYDQIADYFHRLDAATDRMQVVEIGTSTEGRPQLMAIVSSEANMARLARYKEIAQRLALARGLDDASARALAVEGKAVVWVDFGLHSSELAHGQTAPEFAYRVVSQDTPEMRFIRDQVVLLIVPNMNPDGTALWADWYRRHAGGPYERSPLPVLYQKYVGHDNNRDWFMFTQAETRNVGRQLYIEWFPQIVHNQHQSAPFPARIFVPPFEDPMNPSIPPLVMRGVNLVGEAMGRRFAQEGKAGAISRINFDTWWNGGMRSAPYFHNMVGILTETAHPWPAPADYDPSSFPKTFANGVPTLLPSTSYPSPYRGGHWRFADSCEYMMTASMAVLDLGARLREQWLYDIYQMGRDAIRAGRDETYVVPAEQWDPGTAVKLVNTLRLGGVEVERATAPFSAAGRTYASGSFLVRGAQPFRAYVRDLLEPQVYPDQRLYPGGPPDRPYDITGWTLPMQMGVRVDRLDAAVEATTERVDVASPPPGRVTNVAKALYAIDARANDAVVAVNRLLAAGDHVTRALAPFTADGRAWPAGTFLATALGTQTHARVDTLARDLGLVITAVDTPPLVAQVPLASPRIALYQAWGGNADEGWTRWLFEQFGFKYTTVHDADVRQGGLRTRFDVLVLPDATEDAMISGLGAGTMPPEYIGGMTPAGVANLVAFVEAGGTLVALDHATSLAITAFGLPVRDVTRGQKDADYYVPGTLVRVDVDASQPLAFGMPAQVAAFFAHSAAFEVTPAAAVGGATGARPSVRTVATYATSDLLMSGWMLGPRVIAGRAAVVEATVGRGTVVLLGFRTQHRAQPHGTFKLLFNALYLRPSGTAPPTGRRVP